MITIYGSPLCKDCVALKTSLDLSDVEYEYIDITSSMKNLKSFLLIRDNNKLFDQIKKENKVGIPTIIEDDVITLDYKDWLIKHNLKVVETINTCSLDGKNC